MKFSFVVTVYNCEKYISQCIDSLLGQTYSDYEIIIVDDGSKDGSKEIIENYVKNNSNIKYYHKDNGGVSSARNFALNHIQGEWTIFVDADDWLENNALEKINQKISDCENVDIVITDLYINDGNHENINRNISQEFQVENKNELILNTISLQYGEKKYGKKYGNSRCIGGKVFKSKLIIENNLTFNKELITFEDGLFNINAYQFSAKILCSDFVFYHYRQHKSSLTHVYKANSIQYFDILFTELLKFLNNNNISNFEQAYYGCIFESITAVVTSCVENDTFEKSKDCINQILLNKEYINALRNINNSNLFFRRRIILNFWKLKNTYLIYLFYKVKQIVK